METITPTLNSIVGDDEKPEKAINMLTVKDLDFYNSLKPALNQLIKNPSANAVNGILNFSKSL
ncbi:MAG TPA: hypothetical protein VF273_12070 [Pelobium sp.]